MRSLVTSLQSTKRIKKMNIDLEMDGDGNDEKFGELSQALRKQRSLQNIRIITSTFANESDKRVKDLTEGLKRLTFIRNLEIQFNSCDIGLQRLSQTLKKMHTLRNLALKSSRYFKRKFDIKDIF